MSRKKRKAIKKLNLTGFMIILVLLSFLISAATRLVERKESRQRLDPFFTGGHEADVLLLGSSHMINGINPAILFEDYGITSYNLGGHGNVLPVTYWEFVNALDYCTPSYVIIDTYLLEKDYHYVDVQTEGTSADELDAAVGQLHTVLDAFPITKNKKDAIQDLVSDPKIRSEFIWDFIRYHGRWSSLTAEDYEEAFKTYAGLSDGNAILGAEMRYEVDPYVSTYTLIDPSLKMEDETEGKKYLRMILDLCRVRGITPILVQIPFAENEDLQAIANSTQEIADAYQVPFINMNYVADLIDPETDQQSQTHLNVIGAAKTTSYLGAVLSDEVGVPDHRGQDGYDLWYDAVMKYHDQIRENIQNPSDLYSELAFLAFEDIGSIVFINNNSAAFQDPVVKKLVKKLSGTEGIEAMGGTGLGYCLIRDPATGTTAETREGVPLQDIETSFGKVNFITMDKYNLLSVGDSEDADDNQLDYVNRSDIDIQILLYDPATGMQAGHLYFRNGGFILE